MCKKHAAIQLIYGANGSGKSQMVRELMKKKKSYLFGFNDTFSQDFVNVENAYSTFRMITGKEVSDIISPSYSEKAIMLFCYELEAILEMDEPYNRLFIDGFPFDMDVETLDNFLELFNFLASIGFKVTVTTCKKEIRDRCLEYYGETQDFKLIEL